MEGEVRWDGDVVQPAGFAKSSLNSSDVEIAEHATNGGAMLQPVKNFVGHVFNVPTPRKYEHVENVLHDSFGACVGSQLESPATISAIVRQMDESSSNTSAVAMAKTPTARPSRRIGRASD